MSAAWNVPLWARRTSACMPAARPEVNACSGLPPFSYGQLLQISQAQAAEIRALKAGQAGQAAEIKALKADNAALKADKAAATGQAALITKLRADQAAMGATNASQAATIGSLTEEVGTLKGQLASAVFNAGKYQAAYEAFKDLALSKHEAAVKEAEEAIEQWAVHTEQLEQQAAQAARQNAALRKRCNELTSWLSNPPLPPPPPPRQQQQQQHGSLGDVLGKSEALLAEFNQLSVNYSQLRERLLRRDATIGRRNATISQCNAAINERNAIIRTQRVELHMLRPLHQLARGNGAAIAAEASMRLSAHTRRRGSVPWTPPCKSRLSVCTKESAG
ncbi:hypothetical protein OEZ85_002736 [Tetradesmus obliquus]|uniref:Uncharacterized protein n=1 Tax=Tetradesmus obliquus TaxID=3088 RepID=A0ABY8TYH8_TETOB|nr:hypothetical protein OEZ85_002736 [Tetradesmus obliquus]